MKSIDVVNEKKQKKSTVELNEALFEGEVNKAVLYDSVRFYHASQHHGTVKTKNRGEVNRTNKKIYRQKGTGNARHGSKKSAPFVGGGRVFGPRPRDYGFKLPRKVKKLALKEAVRDRLNDDAVIILNQFPFKEIKTKAAKELFSNLELNRGLVILDEKNEIVSKSVKNLVGFEVVLISQLNPYLVLKYQNLVFTEKSFEVFKESYLN